MLMDAELSPVQLLRAWDSDRDGQLEFHEFVAHLKTVVHDEHLWELALRDVAHQAFRDIAGGDGRIDVIEFQRWLSKSWKVTKQEFNAQKAKTEHVDEDEDIDTLLAARSRRNDHLWGALSLTTKLTSPARPLASSLSFTSLATPVPLRDATS